MDSARTRTLLLTLGGGVAVLLISLAVALFILRREPASKAPPPASTGGLVVQMGAPEDVKPDPKTPLRCFVNGQFTGLATLADCARKNGVATRALDVGIDQSGALAAANQAGTVLTPLPPPAAVQGAVQPSAGAASGDCLRYAASGWRKLAEGVSLDACLQALFAGHCERAGGASYGRWQSQTLRLVPHRIEISSDNKSFRTLTEQADSSCTSADF
jgi:hypothetical protein